MFTVKVIDHGAHHYYRALDVIVAHDVTTGGPTQVTFYDVPAGGELRTIEFGTVYIMNEYGSTVGKHRLPWSKEKTDEPDYAAQSC